MPRRGLELRGELAQGFSNNIRHDDRQTTDLDASSFSEACVDAGYSFDFGFARVGVRATGRYRVIWIDRGDDTFDSNAGVYLRRMSSSSRMFGYGVELSTGYERQRQYEIFPVITRQHGLERGYFGGRVDGSLRLGIAEFGGGAFGRLDDYSEERKTAFYDNWWSTGRDGPGKPQTSFDGWQAGGDVSVALHPGIFTLQVWSRLVWQRFLNQYELAPDPRYAAKGRLQFFSYTVGLSFQVHYEEFVRFEIGAYYRRVEGGRRNPQSSNAARYSHFEFGGIPFLAFFSLSGPQTGVPYVRLDVRYDRFNVQLELDSWNRAFDELMAGVDAFPNDFEEGGYFRALVKLRFALTWNVVIGVGYEHQSRISQIRGAEFEFDEAKVFLEFSW